MIIEGDKKKKKKNKKKIKTIIKNQWSIQSAFIAICHPNSTLTFSLPLLSSATHSPRSHLLRSLSLPPSLFTVSAWVPVCSKYMLKCVCGEEEH